MTRPKFAATAVATQPRQVRLILILLFCAFILTLATVSLAFSSQAEAGSRTTELQSKNPNAPNCGPNWTIVTSPNFGTQQTWIRAVDAVSANDVWAVGYYQTGSTLQTVVERWNGTAWNVVPTPNIGLSSSFTSVTAISVNDAWAVGEYQFSTSVYRTLIMHWNGSTWAIVPSPNQSQTANFLSDVSATSANDVWAVGQYDINGTTWTLTLHLIGGVWQVVNSPNVGLKSAFRGVTAISANDIWAVGYYEYSAGVYRTFTQHWNDDEWHIIGSPNVGATANFLYGVTAISTNNVWAVGNYQNGTAAERTLIMQWNGSTWNVITSPNASSYEQRLFGVDAVSANDVWAVGSYVNSAGSYRTLIERWNGNDWNVVTSPTSNGDSELFGVTAVSANDVWAVGIYEAGSVYSTLVERYNPCVASPTPTTTPAPSSTPTPTNTSAPTQTPGAPTPTPVACTIEFTDVLPGSTFYEFVRCMACQGIINGYTTGCETGNPCFRPNNNVTRGQLSKIVANAAAFNEPAGAQQYEDVPPGSTFYDFVWRLANRTIVSGYPCGGPGEPCGSGNLPYFRPNGNASRGQISKIVAIAANLSDPVGNQIFEDVAPGSTFYDFVQRLANLGVMSGYACGRPGEPCNPPNNLSYFRPQNNATRGQTSKIVANTFFPNCNPSFSPNRK